MKCEEYILAKDESPIWDVEDSMFRVNEKLKWERVVTYANRVHTPINLTYTNLIGLKIPKKLKRLILVRGISGCALIGYAK